MDPEPVAWEKIRRLGHWQRDVAALDAYIYLGTGEIKGRAVGGVQSGGSDAQRPKQQKLQTATHTLLYEFARVKEAERPLRRFFARKTAGEYGLGGVRSDTLTNTHFNSSEFFSNQQVNEKKRKDGF